MSAYVNPTLIDEPSNSRGRTFESVVKVSNVALLIALAFVADVTSSNACAATGDRLDRTKVPSLAFSDQFDRGVVSWSNGLGSTGAVWKSRFWYGWQQGDNWTSRTAGHNEFSVTSDPGYNGVNPWPIWGTGVNFQIGKADPNNPANAGKRYTVGNLTTELSFSLTEGYVEAELAWPAVCGVWPALWMLPVGDYRPDGIHQPEIDIMEGQGCLPNQFLATAHNSDGTISSTVIPVKPSMTYAHRYGLWRDSQWLIWYFDDVEVKRAPNKDTKMPMYIILSFGTGGWDNNLNPAPNIVGQTMHVDYVRAYKAK